MTGKQTVKRNQSHLPTVLGQPGNDVWLVNGTGDVHQAWRVRGTRWYCDCPATGLCRHIQAAVADAARAKSLKVSFWTSEADAQAQRRGRKNTLAFTARGAQTFWVTVRRAV